MSTSVPPAVKVPALDGFFDRSPPGLVMFALDGEVLRCNPAARTVLHRIGCLAADADGRLGLADGPNRQPILVALQRCHTGGRPVAAMLRTRQRTLRDAVVLHLHAPAADAERVPPGVLGFLSELCPPRDAEEDQAIVRAVLGLTRAEARVALALHEHADVELAARALAMAAGTARSHIKRVYQKLQVGRQGELILLVERCLAGRPQPGPTSPG